MLWPLGMGGGELSADAVPTAIVTEMKDDSYGKMNAHSVQLITEKRETCHLCWYVKFRLVSAHPCQSTVQSIYVI